MTIENLQQLIADGEHRTLELKKTTGELKDGMHTACAFLNTEGGWLIFGVTPNARKIIGQEVSDDTQRDISNALSGIEPAVDVRPLYIPVPDRPGHYLIALHFEPYVWGKEPYTYHGCPYYRVESTTKQMPRQMFEDRLRAAKPDFYAWELKRAEGLQIKDLDEDRVRGALQLGAKNGRVVPSFETEPFDILLQKLHLLTRDGHPNNAAAMLFGKNLSSYPQFTIRLARFYGTGKNEFTDLQMPEGNFFDLLDAGMAFFAKHLSISGKIVGIRREEKMEVPAPALRESLVNALCHRQWEKYNLSIGVAIYDDRIEIENPGVFPPQITPKNIKEPHISYPYNTLIASVLFKTTFLEQWGSGARRIVELCQEEKLPEPTWKVEGDFIVVTFSRPGGKGGKKTIPETIPESKQNTETKDIPEITPIPETIPETAMEIFRVIRDNPYITRKEIAQKLNLNQGTVQWNIEKLKTAGRIKRIGYTKGGHWEAR